MDTPLLSDSYESLFEQVEFLLKSGEREKAQRLLERLHKRLNKLSEKILARRPELEELRIVVNTVLASVYRQQAKFDEAADLYEQLIASTPATEHKEWQHALATIQLQKGETDAGLDALRALAAAHPDDLPIRLSLGSALIEQELYAEAETVLKYAVTLKTDEDEDLYAAYSLLFIVYKKTGNYDAAENVWKQRQQVATQDDRDTLPLYEMFFEAEDYDKIEYWLAKEKDPLIAGFYRAQLAQRRGSKNARKLWEKVAAIDPYDSGHGWDMVAEAQLRCGNNRQALEIIYESISLRRITMRGILLLAVAQLKEDDTEAAHDTLQRYVKGLQEDGIVKEARIPYAHWQLFTELLGDHPGIADVESYFETVPPAADND